MDPNAPMSWLDMPPSYDGPTQFAPAIPDTRNPYSFTATRDRAFQLEQMKQQEAQMRLQSILEEKRRQREADQAMRDRAFQLEQRKQQEAQMKQQEAQMRLQSILEEKRRQREADQAMPFLQALDPTADTYSEQRRKALLSLPPSALTNPHVQNLVRDQDYLHRASSRSTDDPRVAKVLAEDPGQFETYQDDLEILTPKEAANRLWARHNDNKLKVELASSGYDGDFNDLLGERGYIDPVKAALWKNKNGVRNQAMTDDDRDKLLKELGDTIIKRNEPTSPPEYKAVADARIAALQARLGDAVPKLTAATPATTPSSTGPISTEEAPKYWQESKKELAKHFMEAAGGDAQKFSQMLGNPEAARNALSIFPKAGKPAFTYPRGIFTNDDVHWGEVLEALRHDQGMVGGMGGNWLDASGNGGRVGETREAEGPYGKYSIRRVPGQ